MVQMESKLDYYCDNLKLFNKLKMSILTLDVFNQIFHIKDHQDTSLVSVLSMLVYLNIAVDRLMNLYPRVPITIDIMKTHIA